MTLSATVPAWLRGNRADYILPFPTSALSRKTAVPPEFINNDHSMTGQAEDGRVWITGKP
jgi:hypothetical protein